MRSCGSRSRATARSTSSSTSRPCRASPARPRRCRTPTRATASRSAASPPSAPGDGIISPGGVGYDINCGVRLLASEIDGGRARPRPAGIADPRPRPRHPLGNGEGEPSPFRRARISTASWPRGAPIWPSAASATAEDLDTIEARGPLAAADPGAVSDRAKQRGGDQLGTLGSGNHFVEVQRVEKRLRPRGGGGPAAAGGAGGDPHPHRLAGPGPPGLHDYVRAMDAVMARHGIQLPDRELACAPFQSPEGQKYFGAMCAAANFAFSNRQAITYAAREVFAQGLGEQGGPAAGLRRGPQHREAGAARRRRIWSSTARGRRAPSAASHPETPAIYQGIGQPVLIPGSMGTASYVLVGTDEGYRPLLRQHLPRRRPGDEPHGGEEGAVGSRGAQGPGGPRHRRPRLAPASWPRRRPTPTRTSTASSRWSTRPASPARWRGWCRWG